MVKSIFFGALSFGLIMFSGCQVLPPDLLTVTLDEQDGVPPIDGETSITLPANFQCGDAIASDGAYAITSEVLNNGNCLLHMEGTFEVVSEDLYAEAPDLSGNAINLIQGINLEISTLALDDGTNPIDIGTTFESFSVTILDSEILNKATISTIPTTAVVLDADDPNDKASLDAIKASMVNKEPLTVDSVIDAEITAAELGNLNGTINIDFVAQPEIILGVSPLVL